MSRYERQLPIVGEEGQNRIMSAIIGIAGCGGLGVNVITDLVEAGFCRFVLCDGQVPDISNLNRQFIYSPGDMRPKAEVAAQWVMALNPYSEVIAHANPVTKENVSSMFQECDVIVDCLDNMASRMVLSDYSVESGKPLVHGGVTGLTGQVAVCVPGETACLRCMIGTVKDEEGPVPSVGAAVAAVAGLEALEVVKFAAGLESRSRGRLVTIDLESMTMDSADIEADPSCPCAKG